MYSNCEGEIEDFFFVGDELCFDGGALHVPDGARGVDAARSQNARVVHVPVKRRQRRRKLRLLRLPFTAPLTFFSSAFITV